MITNDADRGDSGSCQVNVNCSEGQNWQNEKKGVAMILVNGTRWCSGSLLNNTSNDQTPYFLTANHCIGSLDANGNTDASFYSFWWNYESSTCIHNSSDFVAESTSGATLVANNPSSDFALFELTESPLNSNIDVYFNGWDRTTSPSQGGVGIHHPSGDFKKIATFSIAPTTGQIWGRNYWRVIFEQTPNGHSIPQGGSSGSPIFQNNGKIIGQIRGSHPGDCNDLENEFCEFGKFSVSWNGSSPQRRLKDWLDPLNTNQSYLDGIGTEPLVTFQNELDIICYGNPKVINLNNVQNQPVTWQTSSNVTTLSSNNRRATLRAKYRNSIGYGWVKAILSDGSVLREDFKIQQSFFDSEKISIKNAEDSSTKLYTNGYMGGRWNWIVTEYDGSTMNYDGHYWDFRIPFYYPLMIKDGIVDAVKLVSLQGLGYVTLQARICNSCGCSEWKEQRFKIIYKNSYKINIFGG